jgi:4-alpha-glucanotransferase
MGPEAYRFADFLSRAKQHLWQILPLNAVHRGGDYSPYFNWSAFAGNTLLISPEMMVRDGFLKPADLEPNPGFTGGEADYAMAEEYRARLFDVAFDRFRSGGTSRSQDVFGLFCSENHSWLQDAVRFKVLTNRFGSDAWQEWPDEIKRRDPLALREFDSNSAEELHKEKFLQFLFSLQWQALRAYCNQMQIQIFGDIPIYVPYNSADVWSHPDLFKLDDQMRPESVSGVPPDYFSATGQLWGHPVYRWDRLQADGYRWWVDRIKHNIAMFDWIRIDHFRGLVAFWEVPASHTSAIDGKWVPAPVDDFLSFLFHRFPMLPMVAEDLGLITADVREVMRRYDIPGMRVALFAFGEDFPHGAYLPHNMDSHGVFFTGTHDTNTVEGWFESEAGEEEKHRLAKYLGYKLSSGMVHWAMIRLVMISPARIALIPFQDVLGLGESSRMNWPGKPHGNWRWRLNGGELTPDLADRMADLTEIFGRDR